VRTVIGIGAELRGDDAAGLVVAGRLRACGVPALTTTPDSLLADWEGLDAVVLVDSVRSGAEPGTIHRIDARRAPLPPAMGGASTHLLGLTDAVELARVTGRLPGRLDIIGIEGRAFSLGAPLSPEVECAVDAVVGELARGDP
jgi:hydrogenase maturation protease